MKCRDTHGEISSHEELRISRAEGMETEVPAHLEACPSWEEEGPEWQPLLRCLRGIPNQLPPPGLREAIFAAIATVEQPRPLSCGEALGCLHFYLDGELEAAQREQVEAHRAVCGSCDRAFAAMASYQELVRSVPEVAPPPDLRNAIYAAIQQRRPLFWERLRHWVVPSPAFRWAALPVAALLLGWILLLRSQFGAGPELASSGELAAVPTVGGPAALEPVGMGGQVVALKTRPQVEPPRVLRSTGAEPWKAKAGRLPSPKASSAFSRKMPALRPGRMWRAEPSRPVGKGENPLMEFRVPWPSPLPSPEQVAVAAAGASSEGTESLEPSEPVTLNYRRMFGAITQMGRSNAVQPEDLGSSTGPSPATLPSTGGSPLASEAPGSGAKDKGPSPGPPRLPEGGSTAQVESVLESTAEAPKLPDLGMGE